MVKSVLNNGWKRFTFLFIISVLITAFYHQGDRTNGVIWADQEGYYIYLPAVFIHGGFENIPCESGCTFIETDNGTFTFTKYTYGVALLEAPFFLIAHTLAPVLGEPQDGKSLPYIWAIMLAAIFYMLAGLTILSKLLGELKFSKAVGLLIPVGILLGTNLFYYTFRESGMSHVYSFFMFSLLLFGTYQKAKSNGAIWNIITSYSLVIIVLIRPTNAIAVAIPLLWGADNIEAIRSNFRRYFLNERWLIGFVFALLIFFIPQVLYWNAATGNFLFYSYGNEGFVNWNSPKMLQVLLSPQNGWLVYSPIVLLGFLGIAWMAIKKQIGWQLPTVVLLLATYVFGSWWAWWFGGAYGHRCYVEYLPLLAIPSAYAVSKIGTISRPLMAVLSFATVLAIFVNLRMSYLYEGMWDGPNWGWYNYLDKLKDAFFI